MTFSVLAAVLGCAVITWYGLADMGAASKREEERRIAASGGTGKEVVRGSVGSGTEGSDGKVG